MVRPMKEKSVVFDMDGILFDTENLCQASWIAIAEKRGMPGMEVVFPKCIGLNTNDSKQVLIDAYGDNFGYETFKQEASEWFWNKIDEEGLPIKPGAPELLGWLKENGFRIALASSTRRTSVLDCVERAGFTDYFEEIVTGDMVEHSKPQPDIFLKACEKIGATPENTFAIEDSYNGIRAAYAAKMIPLMVPDMLPPTEEMKKLSREIFDDLFGVLAYIQAQF